VLVRLVAVVLCIGLLVVAAVVALTRGGGDNDLQAASRSGTIVWAVGDGADGSATAKGVAKRIAGDRPKRVLYLGDVYDTGTGPDFNRHFATVYGRLARRMAPTPGNHDWPHHATGYDPYWRRVKGRKLAPHYAFSVGGWRVISLNSETPDDRAQLAFLHREVARAPGTCLLPFWHRPRFNAGLHRNEQADVDALWREVERKAPLVLSGHDHDYQRFRPVHGTAQYIVGTGGHERYHVNKSDPRLAFAKDGVFSALRMQLAPGVARLSFVTADGDVLDRSTVRCRKGN
jgi:hypothetical protein